MISGQKGKSLELLCFYSKSYCQIWISLPTGKWSLVAPFLDVRVKEVYTINDYFVHLGLFHS